ncbi:MAG: TlpA family protein disulfide reductase [Marinobacter sp.]|nr:TlpA family protein disulfide reductase [Marinobacter sp.]
MRFPMLTTSPKRVLGVVLALLLTSTASHATQLAPDFSLTDPTTGQQVSLEDYRGKVVYLDFWASWCGPCRQSFPFMNELHARYQDQGLVILAVNLDDDWRDAERFLERFPAAFQVVYDEHKVLPPQYGVPGMPTAYFIGRDGQLIQEKVGFRQRDREATEQLILQILAGE